MKINTPKIDIVIFDDVDLVNKLKDSKNYTMNAIGTISWNDWEDQPKLQMIVDGYELIEKQGNEWNVYDF